MAGACSPPLDAPEVMPTLRSDKKDDKYDRQHGVSSNQMKYYDKEPPPKWDGHNPEHTWRPYRKSLQFWFARPDIPKEKQGFLLWEALSGPPKILFDTINRR